MISLNQITFQIFDTTRVKDIPLNNKELISYDESITKNKKDDELKLLKSFNRSQINLTVRDQMIEIYLIDLFKRLVIVG